MSCKGVCQESLRSVSDESVSEKCLHRVSDRSAQIECAHRSPPQEWFRRVFSKTVLQKRLTMSYKSVPRWWSGIYSQLALCIWVLTSAVFFCLFVGILLLVSNDGHTVIPQLSNTSESWDMTTWFGRSAIWTKSSWAIFVTARGVAAFQSYREVVFAGNGPNSAESLHCGMLIGWSFRRSLHSTLHIFSGLDMRRSSGYHCIRGLVWRLARHFVGKDLGKNEWGVCCAFGCSSWPLLYFYILCGIVLIAKQQTAGL